MSIGLGIGLALKFQLQGLAATVGLHSPRSRKLSEVI